MNLLHHAARQVRPDVVAKLLSLDGGPHLANSATFPSRTPGRWTPLQCLCDHAIPQSFDKAARDRRIQDMCDVVGDLVKEMSLAALANVTTSGSTVFHSIAARSHTFLLDVIGGTFDFKDPAVNEVLNMVNNHPVLSYEL